MWTAISLYLVAVSAVVSAGLAVMLRRLALRRGIVDSPRARRIHRRAVPLLGGVAVAGAFTLVVGSHLALASLVRLPLGACGFSLLVMFAGGLLVALVGLWDELRGLSVRTRLVAEFAIAAAVVGLAIRPELGFLPRPVALLVGVVWLVGITNAFNLIDGLDGLAAGLGAIASAILGSLVLGAHPAAAVLLFCLAGACLGFLRLNWHPARMFLGSAGSLFIGYLLGCAAMIATFATPTSNPLAPVVMPLLVFAVPLYDTASVIVIRLRLGRSIFEGDLNHVHHRMMRLGLGHRRTVMLLYALSLAFGIGAAQIARADLVGSGVVAAQVAALVSIVAWLEARSPALLPSSSR